MAEIIVIDAPCGSGKTTWAVNEVKQHAQQNYLFVTPYLSEIKDFRWETRNPDGRYRFEEPYYVDGRKINALNKLLEEGKDVAATHANFLNATIETLEYIKNGKYTLILDEVLDVLTPFNNICGEGQSVKSKDVKMLLDDKHIRTDESGRLEWLGESYEGGRFTDVERLAKRGNLLLLNSDLLVWEFPADVLAAFEKVVILTYMFTGSILEPYMRYHDLPYTLKTIIENDDGTRELTDHIGTYSGNRYKELITILEHDRLNAYDGWTLTHSWYKGGSEKDTKLSAERCKQMNKDLYNFFKNLAVGKKVKASRIGWSCPKEYEPNVRGAGFTRSRKLTPEEKGLTGKEFEQVNNDIKCWIPSNVRATDKYAERDVLAYCVNTWPNPMYSEYFGHKNISINNDAFALSQLIQWVWRSAIRRNKPIMLYIPSTRMRELFCNWLDIELVNPPRNELKKEMKKLG